MTGIAAYRQNLPNTLEDLSRFALIGREKLNVVRSEIRAIDKLKLATEVKRQKLEEAQYIAEIVLDAETKIGELLKEIPPEITGRPKSERSAAPTFTPKQQAKHELDISKDQAKRYMKLAENGPLVEQAKAEAREKGEIVTRQSVFDLVQEQTNAATAAQREQAERERRELREYVNTPSDGNVIDLRKEQVRRNLETADQDCIDSENADKFYKALNLSGLLTIASDIDVIVESVVRYDRRCPELDYTLANISRAIEILSTIKSKITSRKAVTKG